MVCGFDSCFAFNGSSWTTLQHPTQQYCWLGSFSVLVKQGLWVTGPLPTNGLQCSESEWVSEVYNGEGWIQGPQHPNGGSAGSCWVTVNSTHTLYTGGSPTFTESWLYDWTAGEWSPTGNLNEGRAFHGCAALEGQGVLVAGGFNATVENGFNSVELWNPVTGIWTMQPSFPQDIVALQLLSTGEGSVLALTDGTDKVYQRAEDGTWGALEGVVLPKASSLYLTWGTLVPDDFAPGCM